MNTKKFDIYKKNKANNPIIDINVLINELNGSIAPILKIFETRPNIYLHIIPSYCICNITTENSYAGFRNL
jgi:lipoate synthase